jgi:splicing factor 3B subunit 3
MGFQGRLVVGVGKSLRIYDIGKKKLLRKVENKVRLLDLVMNIGAHHFP